jgi:methylenetetrahydrofolate reductase (NADPH)
MKPDSMLAGKIKSKDFIITAEYVPQAGANLSAIKASVGAYRDKVTSVNVADNHYGITPSSLAVCAALLQSGIEPVLQINTRDRNRIALQSDLLGASLLCIKNVLCISGYDQSIIGSPDAKGVFDLDSFQLLALVKRMTEEGLLMDGTRLGNSFAMLAGAVINPYMRPLELNILRLSRKVQAGAAFIQTQAVFDFEEFREWLEAARKEKITEIVAILAGILPLTGADEARQLVEAHPDMNIPSKVIERLAAAGSAEAQEREGLTISAEMIKNIKGLPGLRGVHLLSGSKHNLVPELLTKIQ